VTAEPPAASGVIRVLIVDDHPQVRSMLQEILDDEHDLAVVGECEDGSQVVEVAERLRPDVVCMDMSMQVMDGLDATEALRAARSPARVVMLTAGPTSPSEAAAAGADALVPKGARSDVLLHCVRAVAAGAPGCPYCL
jgi:DNA-binding NarL/FixJ family response regulator